MMRRKRRLIKPGDKFGRLTILSFSHYLNSHKVFNVLCDCGVKKTVTGTHMVQGNISSCGCLFKQICTKEKGYIGFRKRYIQYKANARLKKMKFKLSFNEFKKISTQNCYYCNAKPNRYNPYLKLDGTYKKRISKNAVDRAWIRINGIDRVNNKIGYVKSNCVSCCITCNVMKMDLTKTKFLNKIEKIYRRQYE